MPKMLAENKRILDIQQINFTVVKNYFKIKTRTIHFYILFSCKKFQERSGVKYCLKVCQKSSVCRMWSNFQLNFHIIVSLVTLTVSPVSGNLWIPFGTKRAILPAPALRMVSTKTFVLSSSRFRQELGQPRMTVLGFMPPRPQV